MNKHTFSKLLVLCNMMVFSRNIEVFSKCPFQISNIEGLRPLKTMHFITSLIFDTFIE